MLADFLPVNPEPGTIVSRADVEKEARMFLGLVSKIALIPDRSLVGEERRILRVPIAGHFQLGRFGKVVLDGPRIGWHCLLVEEPAVFLLLVMKAEES